jgi:hypothetical protein
MATAKKRMPERSADAPITAAESHMLAGERDGCAWVCAAHELPLAARGAQRALAHEVLYSHNIEMSENMNEKRAETSPALARTASCTARGLETERL